jgi:hypothetical protein
MRGRMVQRWISVGEESVIGPFRSNSSPYDFHEVRGKWRLSTDEDREYKANREDNCAWDEMMARHGEDGWVQVWQGQ